MKVDFHVHLTASDGTFAPDELVRAATRGGFAAFSITDHDNVDAYVRGAIEGSGASIDPDSLRPVPGIELSIDPGDGFDKFHLLGLGVDPHDTALKSFLQRVIDGRDERNERILANFARIGIDIPRAELDEYARGDVLARPHFAAWLFRHGYSHDIKPAFERYLVPDAPDATRCYEERWHPSQEDAFRIIHGAGGICVMAHPKYWRTTWKTTGPDYGDAERELARLKEAGLDGLEAMYQSNTVEETVNFVRIADRLGLVKSAGSDFHGENKPAISLGMTVDEPFIAPLFDALGLTPM